MRCGAYVIHEDIGHVRFIGEVEMSVDRFEIDHSFKPGESDFPNYLSTSRVTCAT
jgi:hypothetical protein